MATKMNYEAPTVSFLKFDANEILRTSPGSYSWNCGSHGEGDYSDWDCNVAVDTDNSMA